MKQTVSSLHVLPSHLQSLYQRRSPASYIQVVRDAQRLPDVWLVIVESLLEDLPLRWPVSWLPPPVTDHDTDTGWRRQEMPGPWRKRGLQHHRRFTSKLPQVTSRGRVNHNRPDMSRQCLTAQCDNCCVIKTGLAAWSPQRIKNKKKLVSLHAFPLYLLVATFL